MRQRWDVVLNSHPLGFIEMHSAVRSLSESTCLMLSTAAGPPFGPPHAVCCRKTHPALIFSPTDWIFEVGFVFRYFIYIFKHTLWYHCQELLVCIHSHRDRERAFVTFMLVDNMHFCSRNGWQSMFIKQSVYFQWNVAHWHNHWKVSGFLVYFPVLLPKRHDVVDLLVPI